MKNLTLYSDGTPARTFCYISDAIIGYLKAIKNSKYGNIYNIGSDKPKYQQLNLLKLLPKFQKNIDL